MQQQQASLPVLTSAKLFKCIQFSLDSQLHPLENPNHPVATFNRFSSFRRPSKSPNKDSRPAPNSVTLFKWSSNLDIPASTKPLLTPPIDRNNNSKVHHGGKANTTSVASSSSSTTSSDSSSYQLLTSLEDQLPKISLLQLTESIPAIDIELNVAKRTDELLVPVAVAQQQQHVVLAGPRRERCDSGVGGSLSREPVGRRREKWTSFRMSHQHGNEAVVGPGGSEAGPAAGGSQLFISGLSVKQYAKLKKFALLRLTALLEKNGHHVQQAPNVKFSWHKFK